MRKGWLYTREEILWFVKDNSLFIWNKDVQYGVEKRTFTATYADAERMERYKRSIKSEYKRLTNVWTDIREPNIAWNKKELDTIHYTPKPTKALVRIIEAHTQIGDTVLDCFGGSGTTAIACVQTGRNYILIEKDKEICELAKRAIESAQPALIGGL